MAEYDAEASSDPLYVLRHSTAHLLAAALADTFGIDRVIASLGAVLVLTGISVAGFAQRVFGGSTAAPPPRSQVPARPDPGT